MPRKRPPERLRLQARERQTVVSEHSDPGLYIFREGRRAVPARVLARQLELSLAHLPPVVTDEHKLLVCLLRAGELECSLADVGSDDADLAACITDRTASAACAGAPHVEPALRTECLELLEKLRLDRQLSVSRPEGFAYYALHPLDFADVVASAPLTAADAYVVGIRSIGTTLSAVVAAQFRRKGIDAVRTTVRPSGAPYDRRTEFLPRQREQIRHALSRDAVFLVCDEGPGRSGSSFLSVAEALERQGVRRDRIMLLCSHEPDVNSLCAPNGPARWRRYKAKASGLTKRLPKDTGEYLGGGEWRRKFVNVGQPWPAAWTQMERLKYQSRGGRELLKFEGHGHYGQELQHRNSLLAASGFGAPYLPPDEGFGRHLLLDGTSLGPTSMRTSILSPQMLTHLARYCAWRADAFPVSDSSADVEQLKSMTLVNLEREFAVAPAHFSLAAERPTICDGRMLPTKWLDTGSDCWLKLDAASHGDDHFFPGPCDIAWDLAGTCVEWDLNAGIRDRLLQEYRRFSGDSTERRLASYELAYATFRFAWCKMAAASMRGTDDEARLTDCYLRYRTVAGRLLNRLLSSRPTTVYPSSVA